MKKIVYGLIGLLIAGVAQANLVTNGDFESGTVGSTATGWTSTSSGDFSDPWVRASDFNTDITGDGNYLQFRGNFDGTPYGLC
jgi:hypothetical protein